MTTFAFLLGRFGLRGNDATILKRQDAAVNARLSQSAYRIVVSIRSAKRMASVEWLLENPPAATF